MNRTKHKKASDETQDQNSLLGLRKAQTLLKINIQNPSLNFLTTLYLFK